MDVDSIGPGEDFRLVIKRTCESCDVFLPVIGKGWATARDGTGNLRLQNPNDYVRLEIASALKANVHIIPLLVGSADMPDFSSLPVDIQALAFRNAWEISDRRFRQDIDNLVEQALAKIIPEVSSSGPTTKIPETAPATTFAKSGTSVVEPTASPSEQLKHEVRASSTEADHSNAPLAEDARPLKRTAKPKVLERTRDVKKVLTVPADVEMLRAELLAEQHALSGAILKRWLVEGSKSARSAETESLVRRSEEIKKELLALGKPRK